MKRALSIISLLLLCSSCIKDFDELRKDPEGVNIAQPASFLSNALFNSTAILAQQGHTINDQLMQVSVLRQNDNEIHRYRILPGTNTALWNSVYNNMMDFEEMIKLSRKSNDPNYLAVGYTLKAWLAQNITDFHGDVPYTEALQGLEGVTQPKFDQQQTIYDSLINQLDRANDLYLTSKPLTGEDLLFKGSIFKWKKFTNSLRLRILMRVEHKDEKYKTAIRNMLADKTKYPLMTTKDDGAALYYTGVTPFLNPYFGYRDLDFNGKLNYAQYFINYLNNVQDPRLPIWATKGTGGVYIGIPTGYPAKDQTVISNSAFSTYQIILKTNSLMGTILQYAEVEFLLAEACLKGYLAESAETHYNLGVKASMDYWGVTTIPDAFLQHPHIKYNGSLEQVITQKYFALFANGMEQWYEYRRTGFPALTLPADAEMVNNGIMPVRIPFPLSAAVDNAKNYQDAVKQMGPDDINTKVWWQQ